MPLRNTAIPNGIAFAPDRDVVYIVETEADVVQRFDYDEATGELSNPDIAINTSDVEGPPDGLTIDAAGHLWAALWNGGWIACYAPDGTEEHLSSSSRRKYPALLQR